MTDDPRERTVLDEAIEALEKIADSEAAGPVFGCEDEDTIKEHVRLAHSVLNRLHKHRDERNQDYWDGYRAGFHDGYIEGAAGSYPSEAPHE